MAVVIQVADRVADPELFGEAMAAIGAEPLTGATNNRAWIVRRFNGLTLSMIRKYVLGLAYGDPEFAVFEAPESAGGPPPPLKAPMPRRSDAKPNRPPQRLPGSQFGTGKKD